MTAMASRKDRVVALSGGIGGAKLALGLSRVLPPDQLLIIANTGDDFEHLGLAISPDIDTLMYTLAGISNAETGWGRANETWTFMRALESLGGATWFRLGDGDLALHVERTHRLRAGASLSQITAELCARLGVATQIVPMSDDPVRTRIRTPDGWLDFQRYFVEQQCRPTALEIAFEGVESARPHEHFLAAIADPALRAVILCPSNPFVSIEPILALRGVREALRNCSAPVVAVAPIISGRAVKGPTAKMMREFGLEATATEIAHRYRDFLNGYVIDRADSSSQADIPVPTITAQALMLTLEDRENLARAVLAAADALAEK